MPMSNYLENKVQEHILRNIAYTSPTVVYAALYTADPGETDTGTEVTGGSYARQSVTFGAAVNGVCTNTNTVTFPVATAGWGTILAVGIRDALTVGNLLYSGTVTSQAVVTNNQVVFNPGQISITLD